MSSTKPTIINEKELAAFRQEFLSPLKILDQVERFGALLLQVPLGGGKTYSADRLLESLETFERYQCVVYVGPVRAIINERIAARKKLKNAIKHVVLDPRPRSRCGELDEEWSLLESKGCISYAKETLCDTCPERKAPKPCKWPRSLKKKIGDAKIIFCTEQFFVIDTAFLLRLQRATKAEKILLVFDEAKLSHHPFEFKISPEEIRIFLSTLKIVETEDEEPKAAPFIRQWITSLELLLNAEDSDLINSEWSLPFELNYYASIIQEAGYREFGRAFRYIAYGLTGFPYSRRPERWKNEGGSLCFILRPYLKTDILILSANLRKEYVTKQLGLKHLESPLEHIKLKHSETKLYNLKSLLGAERYFFRNHRQILDFFATLIFKNIQNKQQTLLVTRKKFKKLCVSYLESRLRSWGVDLKIKVVKGSSPILSDDPCAVAIVHYGILGVNAFENFQNCFCLNSYYIPDYELNRALQSAEPEKFRVEVEIRRDADGYRKVFVETKYAFSDLVHLGNLYLRVLEVDPPLQAAGRVRFFTKPRTVILFQLHDLSAELGVVTEFRSLATARKVLDLPKPSELDRREPLSKIRSLRHDGLSIRAISKQLKIPSSTVSRWLTTITDCPTFPYKDIRKEKRDSSLRERTP